MKLWWGTGVGFIIGTVTTLILLFVQSYYFGSSLENPLVSLSAQPEPPLLKYSFDRLAEYQPTASPVHLEGVITQEDEFTAYLFKFQTLGNTVSGQLNLPKEEGRLPVVIMLRGYVNRDIYQTGIGTRNAAAVFARNGYVTVAPDFLGYGESDPEDTDAFAARLRRPVTVLDLIASVKELDFVDPQRLFIWGHSNGGQIALSVLQVSQTEYPTTLWAPVTKPFPYSILYFTDTYSDRGRAMRRSLATFEEIYDVEDFSIDGYLDRIRAPLQLHQGGRDTAVPQSWSDDFVEQLEQVLADQLELNYYVYPGADHNMRPDWNTVVARDLEFFGRQN